MYGDTWGRNQYSVISWLKRLNQRNTAHKCIHNLVDTQLKLWTNNNFFIILTLFHQLLVSEIPLKAYRHVFQCISLLHQIMEHADDVSLKLLDWNCEFSVISRNNQVDAKHHHGTTYIFVFLFFFWISIVLYMYGGCSKESTIIILLYYHFICWYFRFDSCLKFMPLSEKLLPRFFLFLRPKVGSQSPVHVAGFGGGGGGGGMKPLLLLSGCLPFLSELAGQICQSINGTCSLYQAVRCVWPNLSSFQSKASLARSNSQFRRTHAFHLRVGQSSWPVVANGM